LTASRRLPGSGFQRLRPRTRQPLPSPARCSANTARPMSMTFVEVNVSLVEMSAALIRKAMKNKTAATMDNMVRFPSISRWVTYSGA
jgi:hypothetical protein